MENKVEPFDIRLSRTIGSTRWMSENRNKLRSCFPPDWVPSSPDMLHIAGYWIKVHGIDWRSFEELAAIMMHLTILGVVEIDFGKNLIRRAQS